MLSLASLVPMVFLAAPPVEGGSRGQQPTELKKLHVLLVVDTDSNLEGLKADRTHLQALLARHIPRGMYAEKLLEGKQATRENILGYYKDLKVGKDDGLLFFYSGHGGSMPPDKHFLAPHNGSKLFREELSKAMEAKGAGTAILLTDCRGGDVKVKRKPTIDNRKAKDATALSPVFRNLFFRSCGTVDITGGNNDRAYGDDDKGGLFTRTLFAMLNRPLGTLDRNHDGVLSWAEFYESLRIETRNQCKNWLEDAGSRSDPALKSAHPQIPEAFKLGRSLQVVVALFNDTERILRLAQRWTGLTTWQTVIIPPGETKLLFARVKGPSDLLPVCEIQVQGSTRTLRLDPTVLDGTDEPSKGSPRQYNFKRKKD